MRFLSPAPFLHCADGADWQSYWCVRENLCHLGRWKWTKVSAPLTEWLLSVLQRGSNIVPNSPQATCNLLRRLQHSPLSPGNAHVLLAGWWNTMAYHFHFTLTSFSLNWRDFRSLICPWLLFFSVLYTRRLFFYGRPCHSLNQNCVCMMTNLQLSITVANCLLGYLNIIR